MRVLHLSARVHPAPWCGHCKRLAPVLDEVAQETPDTVARFAKVDCEAQKGLSDNLCTRFGVRGFPVLKALNEGMEWTYAGPRTKEGLLSLVERMRGPPIREVDSVGALDAVLASANEPVVFFGGRLGGEPQSYESFAQVARMRQHEDSFASSKEAKALAAAAGATGAKPPFVARLERGEAPRLLSSELATDVDAIREFVERERLPTFSAIDYTNFHLLANAGKPLIMLVTTPAVPNAAKVSVADSEVAGSPAAALRALSRDPALRPMLAFGLLDADENNEHISTTYNVSAADAPRIIALQKPSGYRQFAVSTAEEATEPAAMRAFLERIVAGKVNFEYEGMWGRPARWWRVAKTYIPALSHLDFLPNFTFVALGLVLPFLLIIKFIVYDPFTAAQEDARQMAQERKAK